MVTLRCDLSNRQIKAQFRKLIFGQRPFCPRCGYTKVRVSEKRYRCPKCRRPFSLTSSSWLRGRKISWQKLFLLLDCWLKKIDSANVERLLKLSHPSVLSWYAKFRQQVPLEAFKLSQNGYYLIDETYFGFQRRGKRGRGAQGKKPFFGIYDPETALAHIEMVPDVSEETLTKIIKRECPLGATIVSDGWRSYENLETMGFRHLIINKEIEFKRTNQIESCWAHLKRNFRKMYHHCWLENLPDYGREIAYRFCARKNPDSPLTFLQKSISIVPNS